MWFTPSRAALLGPSWPVSKWSHGDTAEARNRVCPQYEQADPALRVFFA